jgi:hypothetical protein
MTMRAGWTLNGHHFRETLTIRGTRPTWMFFIDGKPTARKAWEIALAEARAAHDAAKAGAAS